MKEYELYTGAYTGSKEEAGVRSWWFDGRALREAGRFCGLENPSYVLPWEDRLYTGEMFLATPHRKVGAILPEVI